MGRKGDWRKKRSILACLPTHLPPSLSLPPAEPPKGEYAPAMGSLLSPLFHVRGRGGKAPFSFLSPSSVGSGRGGREKGRAKKDLISQVDAAKASFASLPFLSLSASSTASLKGMVISQS